MAPLFRCCINLDNVALPKSFWDVINITEKRIKNKKNINENKIMKKVIRLTESDLHKIVKNSVKRILREQYEFGIQNDPSTRKGQFELGRLSYHWDMENGNENGGQNEIDKYAEKHRKIGARQTLHRFDNRTPKERFDDLYDSFCEGYEVDQPKDNY